MKKIKISIWAELSPLKKKKLLARPKLERNLSTQVKKIIHQVKKHGDKKLLKYAQELDGLKKKSHLEVSGDELKQAWVNLPKEIQQAMKVAKKNIETFHKLQRPRPVKTNTQPGVFCEQKPIAIEKVGLYIPGGTAPLFSTVFMLAVPAKIAGCKKIILTSPGRSQVTMAAAHLCQVDQYFAVGGAQAIAGLAYGTESIPKVDKIFGPGNSWVTEAKTQVAMDTAIDMPAGPSEVLVIADKSSKSEYILWDLLSQAEHGTDSQVILVCSSKRKLQEVICKIENTVPGLPRDTMIKSSLAKSRFILSKSNSESIEISNLYAPEHLIIQTGEDAQVKNQVINAGSVFIGPFSPESCGDYASGTNHVLPTGGAARAYSGVSLLSFYKWVTFQKLTKTGIKNLSPTLEVLAQAENLYCHAMAAKIRRIQ